MSQKTNLFDQFYSLCTLAKGPDSTLHAENPEHRAAVFHALHLSGEIEETKEAEYRGDFFDGYFGKTTTPREVAQFIQMGLMRGIDIWEEFPS